MLYYELNAYLKSREARGIIKETLLKCISPISNRKEIRYAQTIMTMGQSFFQAKKSPCQSSVTLYEKRDNVHVFITQLLLRLKIDSRQSLFGFPIENKE
jgi:hypothetical protein